MTTILERGCWQLDDSITAVHHHSNDPRKDLLLRQGRDGSPQVFGGAEAAARATRAAVEDRTIEFVAADRVPGPLGELARSDVGRRLLLQGGLAAVATMVASASHPRMAFAADPTSTRGTVVCLYLRGGIDGMTLVPPIGDANYYAKRTKLGVPASKAVPLTSMFGLHPAAASLAQVYSAGDLALVPATGFIDPTRSHFEKQALMECAGDPAVLRSGWLGRHLLTTGGDTGTARAFTLGDFTAMSLTTSFPTMSARTLSAFALGAFSTSKEQFASMLDSMWSASGGAAEALGLLTLRALNDYGPVSTGTYAPANGAEYPTTGLGQQFQEIARTIKIGLPLEVAAIDAGGWDSHTGIGEAGSTTDPFGLMAKDLADSLTAFWKDLGTTHGAKTTVITMSEFGRTFHENGSGGFDHGYGNLMMVMGHSVKGGVYGPWPGLDSASLSDGDLTIAVDYRDVLSELVATRMNNAASLGTVFPNYTPKYLGMFA